MTSVTGFFAEARCGAFLYHLLSERLRARHSTDARSYGVFVFQKASNESGESVFARVDWSEWSCRAVSKRCALTRFSFARV